MGAGLAVETLSKMGDCWKEGMYSPMKGEKKARESKTIGEGMRVAMVAEWEEGKECCGSWLCQCQRG